MQNLLRIGLFCLLASTLCWSCGNAQILQDDVPFNARGVDVEDRVGKFVPLDLVFADENGNKVGLGKYFNKDKAIILTLNYSDCPGLCIAQLDNLVRTLRKMEPGRLGRDFEIVTVSIDPTEQPTKAYETKQKYLGLLKNSNADESWHFLTGKQKQISQLAAAVGFKYVYDKPNKRYNHPAVTYFVSPNGRICRYLLSLGVEPKQLKLAVSEASDGVLAPTLADQFVQLCYLYDPDSNRYSADARRIMAFGGAAFSLMMVGMTAPFWLTRRKKSNDEKTAAKEPEKQNDADSPAESA